MEITKQFISKLNRSRIYLQSCNVTLRSVRDEHLRLLYPHVWVHFLSYDLAQVLHIYAKQIRSWFSELKHGLALGSCSRINYTLDFSVEGSLHYHLTLLRSVTLISFWSG